MSEADKMFEELGYIKGKTNGGNLFYYQINGLKEKFGFEFIQTKYEKIGEILPVCYGKNDEAIPITIQELQAINKKVEELGWKK